MKRHLSILVLALCAATRSATGQEHPVIMIDPGHGGEQAGVEAGDLLEKTFALRAAFALGEEFVARGYDVRLTRTGDYAVGFNERRAMAEAAEATVLISLHFNGDDDPTRHGAEIYSNLDDPHVTAFSSAVGDALRATGAAVRVEARPWEFLQSTTVPTIMIEAAFMTHPFERRLATSSVFHHELAAAIATGTERFLSQRPAQH